MNNHPMFATPPKTRKNGKWIILNAWLEWQENWLAQISMMIARMDEGY